MEEHFVEKELRSRAAEELFVPRSAEINAALLLSFLGLCPVWCPALLLAFVFAFEPTSKTPDCTHFALHFLTFSFHKSLVRW
jgi:hypothetical protein